MNGPSLKMTFRVCEALDIPASEMVRRIEQLRGDPG